MNVLTARVQWRVVEQAAGVQLQWQHCFVMLACRDCCHATGCSPAHLFKRRWAGSIGTPFGMPPAVTTRTADIRFVCLWLSLSLLKRLPCCCSLCLPLLQTFKDRLRLPSYGRGGPGSAAGSDAGSSLRSAPAGMGGSTPARSSSLWRWATGGR